MLNRSGHTQAMTEDRRVLTRPGPVHDESHSYASHEDQVIDFYFPPDGSNRTALPVVFLHGGYWRPEYDRAHARSAAGALAQAGWVTALVEYRREPGEPDQTVSDVSHAIEAVARVLEVPKVIVVGHSAGGHLALVAAHRVPQFLAAVMALAPVSNIALAEELDLDEGAVRAFLGAPSHTRTDLDPNVLGRPTLPVRILHGANDSIVPVGMSTSFGQRWNIDVHEIPGIGHYELIDPQGTAWGDVLRSLEEVST